MKDFNKQEKLLKLIVDNELGKELAQLLYDTKKEVFNDIENILFNKHYYKEVYVRYKISGADLEDLKKRHLKGVD